jgi:glycosyltransferase involved in cell wall biosynthesis
VRWHLVTGEYPPDPGGVADYTAQLAAGLAAAGCEVHVWTSGRAEKGFGSVGQAFSLPEFGQAKSLPHQSVHPVGDFGPAGLARLDAGLSHFPGPRTVLVQYTPHAFGLKAMNIPFVAWLLARRARGDDVRVLFHEVTFPWVRRPLRHNLLAAAHRLMAVGLVRAARHLYVTVPAWADRLRAAGAGRRPIPVLPVPANVPADADPAAVAAARASVGTSVVVGHFGTYGPGVTALLGPALRTLLDRRPDLGVLLIGNGGPRWRDAFAAGRVVAPGPLPAAAVAAHLRACDVLIQPYPDGVSGRRTTVTAALANGVPTVTNLGPLSEPWWAGCGAVALADPARLADAALDLLADPARRTALGEAGRRMYAGRFDLRHTVAALLADGGRA